MSSPNDIFDIFGLARLSLDFPMVRNSTVVRSYRSFFLACVLTVATRYADFNFPIKARGVCVWGGGPCAG